MNIPLAICLVPHRADVSVHLIQIELPITSSDSELPEVQGSETDYEPLGSDSLQSFSQVELNHLT